MQLKGCAFAGLAALASIGCSPSDDTQDSGPAACTFSYLGDESQPMDLQIIARTADGTSQVIDDGADVALVFPPQGGRVIFIGPRATNVDPCYAKITGALRDLSTGEVRVDVRTINLTPGGDGYGSSLDADISSFANVPACPNQWASTDVDDRTFGLEVTLTDRNGKTATKKIQVVPRCSEPDREVECRCICAEGYVLGQPCGSDAGTDASDAGEGGT